MFDVCWLTDRGLSHSSSVLKMETLLHLHQKPGPVFTGIKSPGSKENT